MSVSIELRAIGNVVVLDLAGESSIMDGTILQQTVRPLLKEGKRLFVLNLAGLRHLDSFGLGQMVATYTSVRDQDGDVKLAGPVPTVKNLLRYTRIDTVLKVYASEAEAIQELLKSTAT